MSASSPVPREATKNDLASLARCGRARERHVVELLIDGTGGACEAVPRMSGARAAEIRSVAPDDPDVLRLLDLYYAELRVRVPSYAPCSVDALRADGERGLTLLLFEDRVPVGCGGVRLLGPGTAEVKRMFVVVEARARGHARRLLSALEDGARLLGCVRVVLDTAAPLHEAAAMYLREGYVEIARYNDNPVAARWFAKALTSSG